MYMYIVYYVCMHTLHVHVHVHTRLSSSFFFLLFFFVVHYRHFVFQLRRISSDAGEYCLSVCVTLLYCVSLYNVHVYVVLCVYVCVCVCVCACV